jgi:hypothetical protein
MEGWRKAALTKEEEGFVVDESVECADETFTRSLVGKLWTNDHYNVRIFKQVITQAWRLKNPVEVQDLNKNLFLFRFSSKRDTDTVLRNGPWSFDRNLLVLRKISGEEQPSDIDMSIGEFWSRIYDLPLKLRSDAMARKLGDLIGEFVDVDNKEGNRNGKFLRVKVSIDLRKPLKRGTVITYQGKELRVYFKYERLPTFCYICGRIGHQIKDCEDAEVNEGEDFEDIEEKELPYGSWLKASPLPKITGDIKKYQSTTSCSRNIFSENSSSKEVSKESKGKEIEVVITLKITEVNVVKGKGTSAKQVNETEHTEVESVAESLGNVVISNLKHSKFDLGSSTKPKDKNPQPKKWSRKKSTKKRAEQANLIVDLGKRSLVEVEISQGDPMDLCNKEKKSKNQDGAVTQTGPEVVLENQHRLPQ